MNKETQRELHAQGRLTLKSCLECGRTFPADKQGNRIDLVYCSWDCKKKRATVYNYLMTTYELAKWHAEGIDNPGMKILEIIYS